MAKTKVPGGYISDEAITSAHLHSSHGITTNDIGEHTNNKYYTDARVDARLAASKSANLFTTGNIEIGSDTGKLRLGTGADLRIYHNGATSFIDNFTGNLTIQQGVDDGDIILKCDDGSGGTTAYLTLDGSMEYTYVHKPLILGNNTTFKIGSNNALQMSHNGSNTFIANNVGILYLSQNVDDGVIHFRNDDGSGGVANYITLHGGTGEVRLTHYGNVKLATKSTGVDITGDLSLSGNLTVTGTTTTVDTVTMNAQNAVVFEGATADDHETTLTIIDPTADRTINLPNQSGTIPVLAAASNTAITATPTELNYVDGVTSAIQTQIDSKQATISSTTDLTLSSVVATSSNESRFTALSIGADADIYLYESATNAFTIRTGASGAYKYLTLGASGQLNISGAGLATAGTERISSGGNLTNIGTIGSGAITSTGASSFGTISSGAITSSGLLTIGSGAGAIKINESFITARSSDNANDINLIANINVFDADDVVIGSTSGQRFNDNIIFRTNGSQALRLDSSQNATFAGTISSGAITSTGALTGTSLDINGTGDVSGTLNVGNVQITSTGSIELFGPTNAFIDFKNSSSDDFDSRISGGNSLIFTVGGAGSTVTGLTLASGQATFGVNIVGSDVKAAGSGGLSLQTDEGTKRIEILDSGVIKFNQTYSFPTADGTNGQVLRTDGSGNLSFATVSSGGSGFSTITEPAAGQLKIGAQSGANEGGEILLEKASANGGGSYTTDIHLDNYQNTFRVHAAGNVPFQVAAATGNATILGTLTTGGDITLPNDKDIHFLKADGSNDGTRLTRAGGNALRLKYTGNIFAVDSIGDNSFQIRNSADDIILSVNPNATAASSTTDIRSGKLRMNTTTIVDVNRNLTNIGTIGSGAITSTGASSFGSITSGAIDATSSAEEVIRLNTTGDTAAIHFRDSDVVRGLIGFSNGSSIYSGADDHDMVFRSEAKIHLVSNISNLGLTLNSGNATFGGNISTSGILGSGDITVTSSSDTAVGLTIKRASSSGRSQMVLANESGSELWRFGLTGGGGDDFAFYSGSANILVLDRGDNRATFIGDVYMPDRLRHTGDANTYFQFNAADTARIVVGGSQKFVVNSNGVSISNGSLDLNANNITDVGTITTSGTVTADVSGGTDNYYYYGKESGTVRYSVYENSNNVYINTWGGLYLRANQHGGSGGGLGASGAVFNAANGLSLGTYSSTSGGSANGRLQLYGSTAGKQADLYCSNGNLHIDADDGNGIYLNWYGTQSASSTAGTYFGNANAGQVARIDGSGNFTLSGTVDGVDIAARNSVLTSTTTTANAALPKAGGTMTGTLNMNSNNISNARLSGTQTYLPGHAYSLTHDGSNVYWHIGAASGSTNKQLNLRIYNSSNTYVLNTWNTSGLSLYGNLTLSGTVDGRDVAADGTKLDGIAASANNYSLPASPSFTSPTATDFNANYFDTNAGDGYGLRFWNGSNAYRIFMSGSSAGRLDSTSDYNMYFRMGGGTNRGFVFQNTTTNVAQITAGGDAIFRGDLYIAASSLANNHYNTTSTSRLTFGGGNDIENYHIGTSMENVGGNYTKLDFRWHTGIRMGAQQNYGGIRIFDSEDLGTLRFSINNGSADTVVHSGNFKLGGSIKMLFNNTSNYGIGAGGHNYNSGYFDTVESGLANDPLELVYYQGRGVNIGQTASLKNLGCGGIKIGGADNTIESGYLLHLTSTADAAILIEADSDNVTETHNPFIRFRQDGNAVNCRVGYASGQNYFEIMNEYSDSIFLGTGNTNRAKLDTSGNWTVTGNVTAYGSVSDIKTKENIEIIGNALEKVKTLDGITFNYKDNPDERMTGVIAQQVKEVLPEAIYDHDTIDGEQTYAVRYGNMIGLLIEAVKEQQKQIEELKEKLETK